MTISSSVAFSLQSISNISFFFYVQFPISITSACLNKTKQNKKAKRPMGWLVSWQVRWPRRGTTTYLGNVQSLESAWQRNRQTRHTTREKRERNKEKETNRGKRRDRERERKWWLRSYVVVHCPFSTVSINSATGFWDICFFLIFEMWVKKSSSCDGAGLSWNCLNSTGKTNTSALWVKLIALALLYIWSYIAVLPGQQRRRGVSKGWTGNTKREKRKAT